MPDEQHQIDYEALTQDALRGVVHSVLQRVAEDGLPGDHHFYVTFSTVHPGVGLSKRLRDQFPGEMTIVLQHRFWGLAVHEDRFEVKLTFSGVPERLVVPFAAVKVFFDPSVPFALKFEGVPIAGPGRKEPRLKAVTEGLERADGEDASDGAAAPLAKRGETLPAPIAKRPPKGAPGISGNGALPGPGGEKRPALQAEAPPPDDEPPRPGGGEVVKLDRFRKK